MIDRKVVRRSTVLQKLRISKSTLQRHIASGRFPPPFHLSERISVWWLDEIEEMLNLYSCNPSSEELREKVRRVVRRRDHVGSRDKDTEN